MEPKIIKKDIQDDKTFNSQKKVLVLSIISMVVLLLSSSYAIMTNFSQKDDAITFSTGNLEMTILNSEETFSLINLNNKLPESDQSGLSTATVIPIILKNTGTILIGTYDIKLVSETETENISTLSEDYIKFSISEDNITYSSPSTLADDDNIIYQGYDLEIEATKVIYLKIWIDEMAKENGLYKIFFGTLKVNLEQNYTKIVAPAITNATDDGYGRITFTAVENTNPISAYCVNQNQEDTTNCIWYSAFNGEQTTRAIVYKSGTYYLHIKDNKENIVHSDAIEMTINSNTIIDLSNNDNTGTINGATISDNGLVFDGANDYVSLPTLNTAFPVSYSIRFKTNSTSNQILFGDYTTKAGLGLYSSNTKLIVNIGSSVTNVIETGGITLDTFYTLDITYNSLSDIKAYLNGTKLTATTSTNNWSWTDTNSYIGKRASGTYFNGTLENFKIYNRILSEEEITNNYNGNTMEEGLVLFYKFK